MTSSGSAVLTLPTDKQILVTREFDAPKDLVYEAYTTPELIEKWWAGQRGKVTSVEVDLRAGGDWRYVMKSTEGLEVAFHGTYREIVPEERLVFTEVFEGIPEAGLPASGEEDSVNTVTFTEVDGRTTLTMLTETSTKDVRDAIIESGMEGGMQEALDALEEAARSLA